MWKLLTRTVNEKALRFSTALFILSAFLQGITLALMIPLLRELFYRGMGPQFISWLVATCACAAATILVDTIAMFLSYRVSVFEVCASMMDRVAVHVLALPLGWFDQKNKASVVNALSKQVNTLSHLTSIVIPLLCNAFIIPLVLLVACIIIDVRLSLLMAAAILPLIFMWKRMRKTITQANELESQSAQQVSARVLEFAYLQPILRATKYDKLWEPVGEALRDDSDAVLRGLAIKGRPAQSFLFITTLCFALIILLGLNFVLDLTLDPLDYILVVTLVARMTAPLMQAAIVASELDNAIVALTNVDAILQTKTLDDVLQLGADGVAADGFDGSDGTASAGEKPDGTDVAPSEPAIDLANTEIAFNDVIFSYGSNKNVLNKVSMRMHRNTITAIVGPSGAGKTTILRLIARFWETTQGSITIAGKDIRTLSSTQLMQLSSMVFQDVYLFNMSIKENIRIARPDATDTQIQKAIDDANLTQFVAALPQGWDTNVGPAGQSLSGGERQRVAIARAFLKDAPILLLDEITSALDGENEAAITSVIQKLSADKTVVVVAHRLSTIKNADYLYVLKPSLAGSYIAQEGKPADLAQQEGPFKAFIEASQATMHWKVMG